MKTQFFCVKYYFLPKLAHYNDTQLDKWGKTPMAQFLPMNISVGASWLKSLHESLAPGKLRIVENTSKCQKLMRKEKVAWTPQHDLSNKKN